MIPPATTYAPAGWLLFVPIAGTAPLYPLSTVSLSYKEGYQDFTPTIQDPPFSITTVKKGSLDADIVAGYNSSLGFGVRVELIRLGVYGTILVDSVLLALHPLNVDEEHCPSPTPSFNELSAPVSVNVESHSSNNTIRQDIHVLVPNVVESR
jgi:hypothetical protein